MRSKYLTIRFVHRAELALVHYDFTEAQEIITMHTQWAGYNPNTPPRIWEWQLDRWVEVSTQPEF